MLDVRRLRILQQLATHGTVAATAEALHLTPPAISGVAATPGVGNTAAITWATDEPADSRVEFGTSSSALTRQVGSSAPVAAFTDSCASATRALAAAMS